MSRTSDYGVVRVHDDSYRIDRTTEPGPGPVAFVVLFRDRLGNPVGWRLRPLAVIQGSKSKIWPAPADAIASTKLFTPSDARTLVAAAATAALANGPDLRSER